MSSVPETRFSLIQRLQRGGDSADWDEFVAIYRPVIVRLALRKQLQPADAEDVAQQVLFAVARHLETWKHDPARARFRTWLQTIVRNHALNALTRGPRDQASGGTTAAQRLNQHPDKGDESLDDESLFDLELQRQTFRWAVAQVRPEFERATWDAFWQTAVEGQSPREVAEKTGKTVGAVYIARTRIMQRIKQVIAELDQP